MAAPMEYFKNSYILYKNNNGPYYTSVSESAFMLYDYPNGSSDKPDNLTQLGDITVDRFYGQSPGNTPFVYTYKGKHNGGVLAVNSYGKTYFFTNNSYEINQTITGFSRAPFDVTCFASGTLICTRRGDIAVEDLEVGDVAITASGAYRPITWLGHRTIDCRKSRLLTNVLPVRVAAHAFGAGLPARDLFMSPGHPVLVGADCENEGGHLVPIMCLINGTTIDRVAVDEVTYWHVELDAHDILLAEGLPAESYLDWGDRGFFTEGSDHALANPDFVVPGLAGRCRPVALDGPVVEAERRRLDGMFATRLAAACDWSAGEAALGF